VPPPYKLKRKNNWGGTPSSTLDNYLKKNFTYITYSFPPRRRIYNYDNFTRRAKKERHPPFKKEPLTRRLRALPPHKAPSSPGFWGPTGRKGPGFTPRCPGRALSPPLFPGKTVGGPLTPGVKTQKNPFSFKKWVLGNTGPVLGRFCPPENPGSGSTPFNPFWPPRKPGYPGG